MSQYLRLVAVFVFCSVFTPMALATQPEGLILTQESPNQVVVKGLASGASAQKAGVKEGDVLVSLKGKKVTIISKFISQTKATKPGKKVTLEVRRAGKVIAFKLLVVSRETFLGAGIDAMKGKQIPELVATNVATNEKFELSKLAGGAGTLGDLVPGLRG